MNKFSIDFAECNTTVLKNQKFIFSFAIGLFCSCMVWSQESTNTTGGDFVGAGGSIAFSVGQIAYTTNQSAAGIVTQGVQHAYETTITKLDDLASNFLISVFPNPTTDNLILQTTSLDSELLTYQLFDLYGKLLKTEFIKSDRTAIYISNLEPSTYFIQVVNQDKKQVKLFKIIKK